MRDGVILGIGKISLFKRFFYGTLKTLSTRSNFSIFGGYSQIVDIFGSIGFYSLYLEVIHSAQQL